MSEVKERPITFSAPMIRAILDGNKTMTRRVMKHQPPEDIVAFYQDGGGGWIGWSTDEPGLAEFTKKAYPEREGFLCPYGGPSDFLYVKEAWRAEECRDSLPGSELNTSLTSLWWLADDAFRGWSGAVPGRYRHARFMPRWASRITLEIVGVEVERVQDISREGIEAEGIPLNPIQQAIYRNDGYQRTRDFAFMWDSINGAGSWNLNPWVFAIEFKRVEQVNV